MNQVSRPVLVIVLGFLFAHSSTLAQHHHTMRSETKPAILLPGLGQHKHPISTKSPEAQRFFDQGLIMFFGFNRPEAVRSFRRAAELDPKAAMPYWGLALALGRHLNMDLDMDVQEKSAYEAIQKALALSANGTPVERAYIQALSKRCSADPKVDWKKIDRDYREAMLEVTKQYPDDMDAASLYAESIMNIHRYDWYRAGGEQAEETPEIQNVLEGILRRDPNHPLANHLYIHLLDTSPHPEYALASAYRLGDVVPGAGHLVHMPSHIFMTLGDHEMTARVNERAAQADAKYFGLTGIPPKNIYALSYYGHNLHMILRSRMEQGRFAEARRAADRLVALQKPASEEQPMMVDYFLPNAVFVLLRFQRWDDILALPKPDPRMVMTTAMWRYGRTLAFAAKKQKQKAEPEKLAFMDARRKVAADWMWMFNPADRMLDLAEAIIDARMAADDESAIEHWKKAAALQDALAYDEPPAWYYPVRESLGGALLRTRRAIEAEAIFRENLKRYPRNARSLFGLMESLKAQKDLSDTEWVRREFVTAWKGSPLRIEDL